MFAEGETLVAWAVVALLVIGLVASWLGIRQR